MTHAANAWIRALEYTKDMAGHTFPELFDGVVEKFGDRPALRDAQDSLSYRELHHRANQVSRFALAHGVSRGTVVALLLPNRPDYVAIWLGLTRIGCIVALLNTNLRGDALLHCIRVAEADILIFDEVSPPCELPVKQLWNWSLISQEPESITPINIGFPHPHDRAMLIYTSGTTGLPKATIITHRRILEWSLWFAGMMDTQPTDCLYNCLPMYHSIGGIVAIGSMLVKGGSVVIRERFSASRFWDDICDNDCTIFQYIGELCRYLSVAAPHPRERQHRLRLACGNGLQREVWDQFNQLFAIPQILEFYAATEGSLSLYNCEGKPGAIGRVPPFLAHRFPSRIMRCDLETGVPLRNAEGFCIRCENDEPGEAISKMVGRQFDGYTDPDASRRKILHDVFELGDQWFRSGDIMRKDAAGYYYFVDRLGDTFRWKGENVSTSEVATVLRGVPGVIDAVVYGVMIPGNEGRAGMAAISITGDIFDFATFSAHVHANLPTYAHPLFVRLCPSLAITGTFKLSKIELMREGYTGTTDPIWARDRNGEYRPASS
jgi:fatty-acyl-CoA synthase